MCRIEDNIWEEVFSRHHVDPRDITRVIRLGSQWLYSLDHHARPVINCFSRMKLNCAMAI